MNLFDVLFAKKLSGGGSPFPPVIKRVTGNPVEFTDGADAPLVKCVTEIQGSQDLHGYDKPWVGGAGKNKLPMTVDNIKSAHTSGTWTGNTYTYNGLNFALLTDNAGNITGIKVTGTASTTTYFMIANGLSSIGTFDGSYKLSGGVDGGGENTYQLQLYGSPSTFRTNANSSGDYPVKSTSSLSTPMDAAYITIRNGYIAPTEGITFRPMLRLSTVTDPTFEPYSNICPITAYTEGEIEVSDGVNTTTHTTTFPSAIYRGSEDVVKGTETHDMVVVDMGDIEWIKSGSAAGGFYATFNLYKYGTALSLCSSYNFVYGKQLGPSSLNNGEIAFYYNLPTSSAREIYVKDESKDNMTAAEFKTAVTGQTIAFELATPTTTPVTPTNLPIKSLSGYNHIESTTGDMTIDYITDAYQNFVDTVESALPNTRKGGVKAFDIFKTLDEPKKPEMPSEESEPEEKETEEGAKR